MPDEGPEEWYRNLKPVTRAYMTAAMGTTIIVQMDLLSPYFLVLDYGAIVNNLELWRLVTNFCFFGKFSLPFVFSMFFNDGVLCVVTSTHVEKLRRLFLFFCTVCNRTVKEDLDFFQKVLNFRS